MGLMASNILQGLLAVLVFLLNNTLKMTDVSKREKDILVM